MSTSVNLQIQEARLAAIQITICVMYDYKYMYHGFLVWPWFYMISALDFCYPHAFPLPVHSSLCIKMLLCSDIISIFRQLKISDRDVTKGQQGWDTSALRRPSLWARKTGHCMDSVSNIFYWWKASPRSPKKLHLLLALVDNSTLRLLTNLVVPRQPGELTFKEALTELERHFKLKPFKIAEHFRLYKRNQQTGEIWCVF